MKKNLVASALALFVVAGCGSKDAAPPSPVQKAPKPPAADAGAPPPAPAVEPAPATPGAPATGAAPVATAADPNDPLKNYRTDGNGATYTELQILQRLVDNYNRLQPSSRVEPGKPGWPPLTDLQQLVTVKLIAGIPQAPNGQKYKYDAKTGKVSVGN